MNRAFVDLALTPELLRERDRLMARFADAVGDERGQRPAAAMMLALGTISGRFLAAVATHPENSIELGWLLRVFCDGVTEVATEVYLGSLSAARETTH
jgi:hypothetical protein